MRKIAFISAFIFSVHANAQVPTDSLKLVPVDSAYFHVNMNVVDVVSTIKIRYAQSAARKDVPDSVMSRLYPAGNLSDLLAGSGMMTLKSYYPGGLVTTSARGANSMQTPVIWNGINLQNINNNTVDLSLLPTFLFDYAAVSPGGTSAAFGNGAIGGAIQVNSWSRTAINGAYPDDPFYKARFVSEAGSFGTYMNGVQFGIGKRYSDIDVRAYRQIAQNDFTYRNTSLAGSPTEKLSNAGLLQHGFLIGVGCRTSDANKQLNVKLWVQESKRGIPPTMLQNENRSTQHDYAMRLLVEGRRYYDDPFRYFQLQLAVIHEGLIYDIGYNTPISNTDAWTGIANATYHHFFDNHANTILKSSNIKTGLMLTGSSSIVTEFIPEAKQLRSAAFVSWSKFLREDDEFNITIRQEFVNDKPVDPVGNIWYYVQLRKLFSFRACISHNYRIPTFNDLYWRPGGNTDLKAETSWTEELSVDVKKKWHHTFISYIVTGYNRDVTNMITWVPMASYWSPVNVAAVKSRGVEHRFKLQHTQGRLKITLLLNADYIRSTYAKSEIPNDVSIGKQLIYVPAWFGSGSLTLEAFGGYLTYMQSYTDLRFTTRDHVEWLPAYSIGNASVGYSFASKKSLKKEFSLNVFFRCNNITGVEYQAVAWRPMPGRNFTLGLSVAFGKLLTEEIN